MLKLLKTLARRAIWQLVFLADAVVAWNARRVHAPKDSIVVIRIDGLGDFLLWLSSAKGLRQNWPWPGRRFVLVGNAAWADFARDLNLFDEVVAVNRSQFWDNLRYRLQTVARMAQLSAELVIVPFFSRHPASEDSLARAINADRRIAVYGHRDHTFPFVGACCDHWYDEIIRTEGGFKHEVLSNIEFLSRACGIDVEEPWFEIRPGGERPPMLDFAGDYAVIAAAAIAPLRVWPAANYAELIARLAATRSLKVVLIGSAGEKAVAAGIAQTCGVPVLDLTGKLSLAELMPVLSQARVVISNETGISHLAAALRVPAISLTGGGHFNRFVPYPPSAADAGIRLHAMHHAVPCYQCNWKCIYVPQADTTAPCITAITVDDLLIAVQAALKPSPAL